MATTCVPLGVCSCPTWRVWMLELLAGRVMDPAPGWRGGCQSGQWQFALPGWVWAQVLIQKRRFIERACRRFARARQDRPARRQGARAAQTGGPRAGHPRAGPRAARCFHGQRSAARRFWGRRSAASAARPFHGRRSVASRRDEESFSVSWSTVHARIHCARKRRVVLHLLEHRARQDPLCEETLREGQRLGGDEEMAHPEPRRRDQGHCEDWQVGSSSSRSRPRGVEGRDEADEEAPWRLYLDGIPECHALYEECPRCKAGGLPPPAHLPQHGDAEQREAAEKNKQEEDEKANEIARQNEECAAMEMEIMSYTSPALTTRQEPGVSAGSTSAPAQAISALGQDMLRVCFARRGNSLLDNASPVLETCGRATVLVDATTASLGAVQSFVEFGAKLEKAYSNGSAPEPKPFRVVALCGGARFDANHKVLKVAGVSFPMNWTTIVVQIWRKSTQSKRAQPSFAVLACAAAERNAAQASSQAAGSSQDARGKGDMAAVRQFCGLHPVLRFTVAC